MNKIYIDAYIKEYYNDLCDRVDKKINNMELTKEIFSRVFYDVYKNIENEKYNEIVRDNNQLQRYLIKLCLNTYKWGNSDFYRTERLREYYVEDYFQPTEESEENYRLPSEQIEEQIEQLIDRKILIKLYPCFEVEYERLNEAILHNNISVYYNSLPMSKQILFELLYIEELSGREIHKLLNSKLKISESHIYRMIQDFKLQTLNALS